jgi:hydrogenase maturation factor
MISRSALSCSPEAEGHCALCGDEALAMRVIAAHADATATVLGPSGEIIVATDLVGDVRAGDALLVHQGFAIARLEPSRT